MKVSKYFWLLKANFRRTKLKNSLLILALSLGIFMCLLIISLGLGVEKILLQRVLAKLPLDMVEVLPKSSDLGMFKVNTNLLLSRRVLNDETLSKLRQLPGVVKVYPKLAVNLPLGARGGHYLFGKSLYTDLFMNALPAELLELEEPREPAVNLEKIPVVISPQLLDIYNSSVAPALNTPKLNPQILKGFKFELVIGNSLVLGSKGVSHPGSEQAEVVGVSPYALRLGVSVSLRTAAYLLTKYTGAPAGEMIYTSAIIQLRDPKLLPQMETALTALGLSIEETASKISAIIWLLTLAASSLGILSLLLTSLYIAHSFFQDFKARERELAILRALGARFRDLLSLLWLEATVIGLGGGLLGIGLAELAAFSMDQLLKYSLGNLPVALTGLFIFPYWLYLAGLSLALLAAWFGALFPAFSVSKTTITRSLARL